MNEDYIVMCVYELEHIDQKYARQVLKILEAYRYKCDKEKAEREPQQHQE